MRENINTYK